MTNKLRKKKPVGLCLDLEVIEYFKIMSDETGLPYQGLINFCLREAIRHGFMAALGPAIKAIDSGDPQ